MNKGIRLHSIDVYRAITMILMLWVNDFAGITGIPHWLGHAAADEDMMGFSDIIFPTFLFCVGLSLPLALGKRLSEGGSSLKGWGHVLLRSLALIVMGLFSMNSGSVEGGLNGTWFKILMVLGFFLVWDQYPEREGKGRGIFTVLKLLGVALLAYLVIQRVANGAAWKVGWWGILGLIGWAYLFGAVIFLLVRGRKWLLVAAWALVALMSVILQGKDTFFSIVPGFFTHLGLVMGGVVCTSILSDRSFAPKRYATLWCIPVILFALAVLCHRFWIISKIQATPTWMFYILALAFAMTLLLHYVCDVRGFRLWSGKGDGRSRAGDYILKPAGTATLTCYTLPYLWLALWRLFGLHWPKVLLHGGLGLVKSMLFALLIVFIAGLLSNVHIKLKI